MKKRGLGHVEVIVSFVIFVAAIGTALYFFNPGGGNQVIDSSFIYVEREIVKNASVAIEVYSAKVDGETMPPEYDSMKIEIPRNADGNSRVFPVGENDSLQSFFDDSDDSVYVSELNGVEFVTIYISEAFDSESGSLAEFLSGASVWPEDSNGSHYEISSYDSREIVSEKSIQKLKDFYDEDYFSLKEEFNLPNRVDFSFRVEMDDGGAIEAVREIPQGFEVFSREKSVELARKNGVIENAKLVVRIW